MRNTRTMAWILAAVLELAMLSSGIGIGYALAGRENAVDAGTLSTTKADPSDGADDARYQAFLNAAEEKQRAKEQLRAEYEREKTATDAAPVETAPDGWEDLTEEERIQVLAQKATELICEMAQNRPQSRRTYRQDQIEIVRSLYTPTATMVFAYAFEFQDGSDACCVVMNAFTKNFLCIHWGKSPYTVYLEDRGVNALSEKEYFIYNSIGGWVGTVQDGQVTIVDMYTDEVIAVEDKSDAEVDQEYLEFYNCKAQSAYSSKDDSLSTELEPLRVMPSQVSLVGVGNYVQDDTGHPCIPTSICNALVYYRNT